MELINQNRQGVAAMNAELTATIKTLKSVKINCPGVDYWLSRIEDMCNSVEYYGLHAETAAHVARMTYTIAWTMSTSRTCTMVDNWIRSLSYKKLLDLIGEVSALDDINMGNISRYLNTLDGQITQTMERGAYGNITGVVYTRNKKAA